MAAPSHQEKRVPASTSIFTYFTEQGALRVPSLLERHMQHIHTDWQGGKTRRNQGIPGERYLNK